MSNIKKENNVSKKEEKVIKTEEKVDKKNIDYKAIIIWAIFIIVFIFFIGFLYKNFFTSSFSNSDVESIINDKKTQVPPKPTKQLEAMETKIPRHGGVAGGWYNSICTGNYYGCNKGGF